MTWPDLACPAGFIFIFLFQGALPWSECWLISAGRCFVDDDHGEHEHEHGPSIIINQSIMGSGNQGREDDNLDMSLSELCKQASQQTRPIKNWPRKPFLQSSPILHLHLHNHHNGMSGSLCCCCCWSPSVNLVNSTKQQYNSKISYRPRRQGVLRHFEHVLSVLMQCSRPMRLCNSPYSERCFQQTKPTQHNTQARWPKR